MSDPVERVRRILAVKGPDYWELGGRTRFARELAEDGLSGDELAAAITSLDREMQTRLLDDALGRVRARE